MLCNLILLFGKQKNKYEKEIRYRSTGDAQVYRDILQFGLRHGAISLADTVSDLYDAALKDRSRRTHNTGQRAYFSFVLAALRNTAPLYPFKRGTLNTTELYLAFFMASLVLKPTITSASTVLGYETHCKYLFRAEGCDPSV